METAERHVFLLMQISYPYIAFNNVPLFQENRASSFWDMRQSMCVIVVEGYHYRGWGVAQTRLLSVQKDEKITKTIPIPNQILHNFFFYDTY